MSSPKQIYDTAIEEWLHYAETHNYATTSCLIDYKHAPSYQKIADMGIVALPFIKDTMNLDSRKSIELCILQGGGLVDVTIEIVGDNLKIPMETLRDTKNRYNYIKNWLNNNALSYAFSRFSFPHK